MGILYEPRTDNIAALIARQGDIAAQRASANGQIWGRAAENLGQIGGAYFQQREEEKKQKQRDAAVMGFVQDPNIMQDPETAYRKAIALFGLKDGHTVMTGLLSAHELAAKQGEPDDLKTGQMLEGASRMSDGALAQLYPTLRDLSVKTLARRMGKSPEEVAQILPEQWDPSHRPDLTALAQMLTGKAAPEREQHIVATGPIVDRDSGKVIYQPPKTEKAGTIEQQYLDAVNSGDTATAQRLLGAHKQFREAGVTVNMPGMGGGEELSPAGIDVAALRYLKDGSLPPIARDPGALKKILGRAATLTPGDKARIEAGGLDVAANKAGLHADTATLTAMQKQVDAVSAFERTAASNAKLLDGLLDKIPDYGSTYANKPARNLSRAFGSTDLASFNTLRQSVANEYSRILSNPNLSGVMSDSARSEGAALLDPDATPAQLRAAIKTLAAEAKNRHTEYQGQLDAIKGRISGKAPGPLAKGEESLLKKYGY